MKPFIKLMFISTLAAVSSAQAVLLTGSGESGPNGLKNLEDRVIVAETYSSQGAFAVINGNIQSGTYTSLGAGNFLLPGTGGSTGNPARYGPSGLGIYAGTIRGDVYSGTSTSTGDGAVVHGNISSGGDAANTADGFTMIGANGGVGGNINSDTYTSTGANALIKGDITALSIALGASTTVDGHTLGIMLVGYQLYLIIQRRGPVLLGHLTPRSLLVFIISLTFYLLLPTGILILMVMVPTKIGFSMSVTTCPWVRM
jgi:hypothetical protein